MCLQPPSRSFNVMSLPDFFLPAYPRSLKAFPSLCRAYYNSFSSVRLCGSPPFYPAGVLVRIKP